MEGKMTDAEKIDLIATKIMGWRWWLIPQLGVMPHWQTPDGEFAARRSWNPLTFDADCAELRRKMPAFAEHLLKTDCVSVFTEVFSDGSAECGIRNEVNDDMMPPCWSNHSERDAVVNCALQIALAKETK
jgi:hypothetical protein